MNSTPPPLPLGTLLGAKYRLEALLGQGGMGAVYLAENVDIGRKVAVKVLLPEIAADAEALARFKIEARAAAAIGHPNIAEVIDFGTSPEGGAFLVMEYLQGETLGGRLRRAGPLEVEAVGWIADELLAAVAAAHAKGVIHRDLKPDNVFLVEQPVRTVKVLDFGVSKFREQGQVALTRTGMVMGTPAYMSPEQARGAKDVGPASDLYAVGALLYEALAGAPAFEGESYNEVLAKVLTEQHPPLSAVRPGLPSAVEGALDRLLAKTVADRPADALQARCLLAQAFGVGGPADSGAATQRPGPGSSPGFASTLPRTPAPAFAPTAPPTPRAAPAPPAVVAAAPAEAAPAAEAKAPKKKSVWRYVFIAFLVLLGLKGCQSCGSCAGCAERKLSQALGIGGLKVSTHIDEDGKKTTSVELRLADAGTVTIPDLAKYGEQLREREERAGDAGVDEPPPDFQRLGSELGKAVDEAMREKKQRPPRARGHDED